jgi:hypothetical protein
MKTTALAAIAAHSIIEYGLSSASRLTHQPISKRLGFLTAIVAANSSETDHVVHTPKLPDGERTYAMPVLVKNVHNVNFVVDGEVVASSDNIDWQSH